MLLIVPKRDLPFVPSPRLPIHSICNVSLRHQFVAVSTPFLIVFYFPSLTIFSRLLFILNLFLTFIIVILPLLISMTSYLPVDHDIYSDNAGVPTRTTRGMVLGPFFLTWSGVPQILWSNTPLGMISKCLIRDFSNNVI